MTPGAWIRATGVGLAMALVAAACGGGDGDDDPFFPQAVADVTPGEIAPPETPSEPLAGVATVTSGAIGLESFEGARSGGLTEAEFDWGVVAGTWVLDRGTARLAQAPDIGAAIAVTPAGRANGLVQVTMPTVANGTGLIFRYIDADDYWALVAAPRFATWNLQKVVKGDVEVVGNVGLASIGDFTTVGVLLELDKITITVQGRPRLSVVDSDHINGQWVGLLASGADALAARWDDLLVVPLDLVPLRIGDADAAPPIEPAPTPTATPSPTVFELRLEEAPGQQDAGLGDEGGGGAE